MLRLEDAIGYRINPERESVMLKNMQRLFDNPDHICFHPPQIASLVEPVVELYSLREGLLLLWSLVRFGNNRWSAGQAHRMLETLNGICDPNATWNLDKLKQYHRLGDPSAGMADCRSITKKAGKGGVDPQMRLLLRSYWSRGPGKHKAR